MTSDSIESAARATRDAFIEGVKLDARNHMRGDHRVWHEALVAALDATLPAFWDYALAWQAAQQSEQREEVIDAAIEYVKNSGPFRASDGYMAYAVGDDRRLRAAVAALIAEALGITGGFIEIAADWAMESHGSEAMLTVTLKKTVDLDTVNRIINA